MTVARGTSFRRKESRKEGFDLDEVLKPLGGFGKFQFVNFIQIGVIITLASVTEISYVFTSSQLKHRCLIPECEVANNTEYLQPWLSSAIPLYTDGQFTECKRYTISKGAHHFCEDANFTSNLERCDDFVYETEEWTIAREDWGIHCEDDRWMLALVGSINNAGLVIGSFYVGFLCDRFGRKAVIVAMSVMVAVIGTIKSFSVNYPMFISFEFLETCLEGGLYTLPFVLALEIVSPSKRVFAGCIVACAYPLGEVLAAVVQMLTLEWRTMLRIVRVPYVLIGLFYWTLPESVRWLIAKKRNSEAVIVLKKIAKLNRTTLAEGIEHQIMTQNIELSNVVPNKKKEYIDIAKSRILRLRFLAIVLVWVANTFVFFGMNLTSVSINDNKFVNAILTSAIEIPSYLSAAFYLTKVGRKYTQSISLFLCTLGCLLFAFVPDDWTWAQLLLFLVGKYGIAVSFITTDVYTTELFPTGVRASAISTGHMIGRIAAIVAPQTPLLADIYKPIPLLLFSAVAALGGACALTLPETLNTKLPDTVKEAEELGSIILEPTDTPSKISTK